MVSRVAPDPWCLMTRRRYVQGKANLLFAVAEGSLPGGGFRTTSIEGTIRLVRGRQPHSGTFRSPFDHHGHLIADLFGGPGGADSGNIVAMHGYSNNGAGGEYRAMERAVEAFLQAGGDAWMRVRVTYNSPAAVRPHRFDVEVRYANGMHSAWRIFNYASYLPNPAKAKPR